MTVPNSTVSEPPLTQHLAYLQLPSTRKHFEDLAQQAAEQHWSCLGSIFPPSCRVKPINAKTVPFNAA